MGEARKKKKEDAAGVPLSWDDPRTGNALAVAAGLGLVVAGTLLPLVGAAGAATPYARRSFFAFLLALLAPLVLGALASNSKWSRRKTAGGPLPWVSLSVTGLSLFLLAALLLGALNR